jgi:SAM-dependent methyltransferase
MDLWGEIGRQLGHPAGMPGRVMGGLMLLANRRPNALAIEALEIEANDIILELGFGPGHAIKTMAAMAAGGRIHGVDRSSVMFAQAVARNRTAIRSGRVLLHQCSFDELPLRDASIDKILAVNVIYFWTNAGPILREARRVLRPGGIMTIYATDAATMRHWKFAGPDTHQLFAADELNAFLRDGGFDRDELEVRRVHAGPGVSGLIAIVRKRDSEAEAPVASEFPARLFPGDQH